MDGLIRYGVLTCIAAAAVGAVQAQTTKPPPTAGDKGSATLAPFKSDKKAEKLYRQCIGAMRQAKSLSWTYTADFSAKGSLLGKGLYKIWLKKPNYARVEAYRPGQSKPTGVLVLDGDTMWTYWPQGKPRYGWEYTGKFAEAYEKYKDVYYTKQPAPLACHSIGHVVDGLGLGTTMPIIDPSTFHGYTDSLQKYYDGAMSMGTAKVGGELCDVIEVSLMKRQRSWILHLSRKDHLPRRLRQFVRVKYELEMDEVVSNLKVNAPIPNRLFAWKAPAQWKVWRMPAIEEGLLAAGTAAPEFDLPLIDGGTAKLSDYRGKIVWLNIWRCG